MASVLEHRAEHHATAEPELGQQLTMDASPGWAWCLQALPLADPLISTTFSLHGLCLPPSGGSSTARVWLLVKFTQK